MVGSKDRKKPSEEPKQGDVLVCPLGQDVPAILSAIDKKDTKKAAKNIRETNALPCICGRVCIAPCMRALKDGSVTLPKLKQIVKAQGEAKAAKITKKAKKVAVVGSGPAGLAGAHQLLLLGMKPVVFEAADKVGGMLGDIIPSFVLPRKMLESDIANLVKMGVEISTGVTIGKDVTWSELAKDYDAVLVATGARKSLMPGVPGATLKGTTNAVDFCRNADDGKAEVADAVVVEGGSNPSLQVAITAKQQGAKEVHVVHPFPIELWPASADMIAMAKKEGVAFLPDHRVTELWGYGELDTVVVRAVETPVTDSVGRVAGTDQGKQVRIPATQFIATVSRTSDEYPEVDNLDVGILGNIVVDTRYGLEEPGWYAAGEAATGAAGVVDSMATARLAARAIKNDLEAK